MKGWEVGGGRWEMGEKGKGNGREGGGRLERRKWEELKQKGKIDAIREMGEKGGRWKRDPPVCPLMKWLCTVQTIPLKGTYTQKILNQSTYEGNIGMTTH